VLSNVTEEKVHISLKAGTMLSSKAPLALLGDIESQNHRIVGVGRDLCGSSSPTPLPKQGHLQ